MSTQLPPPDDWEIRDVEDGKIAIGIDTTLLVIDPAAAIFKRNGIKMPIGEDGTAGHVRMLVGEIDGVKVYVRKRAFTEMWEIVMTKDDLYP